MSKAAETTDALAPPASEALAPRQEMYLKTAYSVAWVSGIFTALVSVMLVLNMYGLHGANPANNPALKSLLKDLKKSPTDEKMKQTIRDLDYTLRVEYFQRQTFGERGAWLLFLGAITLHCSLRWQDTLTREPHLPDAESRVLPHGQAAGQVGRGALAAGAGVFLLLGGVLYATLPQVPDQFQRPPIVGADGEPVVAKVVYPTPDVLQKQWASWRGYQGGGIAPFKDIPREWNGRTGKNILWKTPLSLPGKSSPIVWGDRVFVTGAGKNQRMVYGISATDGKLLWGAQIKTNLNAKDMEDLEVMDDTTFAAPTPVTDGRHVYAIFATGDVAAVNFRGKVVWHTSLPAPDIAYGYASSLVQVENILIVQYDQAYADDGKSVLIGLDTETGKIIYQEKRPVGASWSSPIVAYIGGKPQVISAGNTLLIGSDPNTGKTLWSADVLAEEHAPSPVVANGMVYAVNEMSKLSAIKLGGAGDVTKTHFAWDTDEALANIPSPLATPEYVYMINIAATAVCFDAKTGEKYWEKEIEDGAANASPSLVGDRVYFVTKEGVTVIIKNGKKYEEIARNPLGEEIDASPAFQDGRIYLRGNQHLYAIGKK